MVLLICDMLSCVVLCSLCAVIGRTARVDNDSHIGLRLCVDCWYVMLVLCLLLLCVLS